MECFGVSDDFWHFDQCFNQFCWHHLGEYYKHSGLHHPSFLASKSVGSSISRVSMSLGLKIISLSILTFHVHHCNRFYSPIYIANTVLILYFYYKFIILCKGAKPYDPHYKKFRVIKMGSPQLQWTPAAAQTMSVETRLKACHLASSLWPLGRQCTTYYSSVSYLWR